MVLRLLRILSLGLQYLKPLQGGQAANRDNFDYRPESFRLLFEDDPLGEMTGSGPIIVFSKPLRPPVSRSAK